ncbi:MAG: prepilin-type N-terminal cleavage/methylation domain-containing protein [Enterococcus sp.]|nr:prepilin-type N-terminal cleavage/methylation domain-containing protein [Enterococcus sp.]
MKTPRNESGFTLVEILVVVLIIGILSAIAVPMYLSQRHAAVDASIQSNVSEIQKALDLYYVKHNTYPHQGHIAKDGLNKEGAPEKNLGLNAAVLTHPKSAVEPVEGKTIFPEKEFGSWVPEGVFNYRSFSSGDADNPCWSDTHKNCDSYVIAYKTSKGVFTQTFGTVLPDRCKLVQDYVACSPKQ